MAHLQKASYNQRVNDSGQVRRNNLKKTILRNLEYKELQRQKDYKKNDDRYNSKLWPIQRSTFYEMNCIYFKQSLLTDMIIFSSSLSIDQIQEKMNQFFHEDINQQFKNDIKQPITIINGMFTNKDYFRILLLLLMMM